MMLTLTCIRQHVVDDCSVMYHDIYVLAEKGKLVLAQPKSGLAQIPRQHQQSVFCKILQRGGGRIC